MNIPFVSVIMSVYNTNEFFLKQAIESVLNQTYPHFEFIIIDDASTNNIKNIVSEFNDRRIIFIRNSKNFGLTKSLNIALEMSKGDYIARMDADDISIKERLEKQVSFLERNTNVGLLGSNAIIFGNVNGNYSVPEKHEHIKATMLIQNPIIHSSVMLRRSALNKMIYNENCRTAQDYEFWSRLIWVTDFYNLKQKLIKYRVHGSQITSIKKEEQSNTADLARKEMLSKFFCDDQLMVNMFIESCTTNIIDSLDYLDSIKKIYQTFLLINKQQNIFDNKELFKVLTRNYDRLLYVYARKSSNRYNLKVLKGLGGGSSIFTFKKYVAPLYPLFKSLKR